MNKYMKMGSYSSLSSCTKHNAQYMVNAQGQSWLLQNHLCLDREEEKEGQREAAAPWICFLVYAVDSTPPLTSVHVSGAW